MSSFDGNSSHRPPSFDTYQFDFGLGGSNRSSASRPLKDQKSSPYATPAAASRPTAPARSHQPSRPSWTPAAPSVVTGAARSGNLANTSVSMVGDIFGKTWVAAAPPSASSGIGIPKSDPNLFGDLVGSALGQGRSGSGNVPLKSAAPRDAFSMGNLSDSLPRPTTTTTNAASAANSTPMRPSSWGYADFLGNSSSFAQPGPKIRTATGGGGQPMGSATGMQQNANSMKNVHNMTPGQSFSAPPPPQPTASHKHGTDPLDMFFSSPAPAAGVAPESSASQQFSEINDWDLGSEFGGHETGGPTTELEGLPPPPAGITAPTARTKGLDNYKQGQFADAIKWLSWAVVLLEKSGDNDSLSEVLSCRASCYKEVGEYKKAVSDCSKVLDKDTTNVPMLVQRALLYESMEKYKLGAADLRMVLKIDPGNRLARSTIHRLNKFAD
ncbi:hypothetical protein OPV22_013173 [Ensete ventricosum]|uniref:Ancestral coatomer element 1 Sec16/Sec31 domain-containing protein n=1 Tax=Ensete ventricosum TaxID=4639 RepID=A0AAV8QUW2_ENSVE|nr:hypothetical protein OPV22_013173 [Ensete ventricosum]